MERTLFIFSNGDEDLYSLSVKYTPWAILLNRLLSEKYVDKKLKLLNFFFSTEETHKRSTVNLRYYINRAGNVLSYDDVFDLEDFLRKSEQERVAFLWRRSYEILVEACEKIKNSGLLAAAEYAYHKGLEMDLNPDYVMLTSTIILYGQPVEACLWARFGEESKVMAEIELARDGVVLFRKIVEQTRNDYEIFYEMFKKIEVDNKNRVIIKGRRDIDSLPIRIPIDEHVLTNA